MLSSPNKFSPMNPHDAETIALNVLNFLMADEERRERFMNLSGMDPQALRDNATEPVFLTGILDYLLQNETLIYLFAEAYNVTPDVPATARRAFIGAGDSGDVY